MQGGSCIAAVALVDVQPAICGKTDSRRVIWPGSRAPLGRIEPVFVDNPVGNRPSAVEGMLMNPYRHSRASVSNVPDATSGVRIDPVDALMATCPAHVPRSR